jgi:signal transduction histidine kinase
MISDSQTERLSRERGAVTEIVQTLTAAPELQITLNAVIDKLIEVVDLAETVMIFLWDDTTGILRPYAVTGYDSGVFKEIGLQIGESVPGKVLSLGHAYLYTSNTEIAKDLGNMRSVNLDLWWQALGREYRPNSILAAPITSSNKKLGVLVLEVLDGSIGFSEQDLSFIQLIADLVSLRVERDWSGVKTTDGRVDGRIRSEWVETISHELGIPLTAIKGYATALLLDEVEWSLEKRQEFLQQIEDECNQMETLLSDLLNSTLIDMDELSLETQPLHVSQVAQQVSEEMERRTDKHHLIVDFPENYEVRSSYVAISISDQGIGIPPEDLIQVFDKYVRAKSRIGVQIPGTGLGLPIARTIVEAHGGHIWVDSVINQGTTMSFSLPYEGFSKLEIGDINESGTHPDR